jgi:hypothetical protein
VRDEVRVFAARDGDDDIVAATVAAAIPLDELAEQLPAAAPLVTRNSQLRECHLTAGADTVLVELHRRSRNRRIDAARAPTHAVARHCVA